jgi:hypothetical protein
MKKVFTLIAFFVLLLNYSKGQVRITEVKPIDANNDETFVEFYYKGPTTMTNYSMVVYVTKNSGEKILTVTKFNNVDYFNPSTTDVSSSTHTRGAVVFSRNSIGAGLSYSRLYSNFESVNRYNVVNNQVGTPTLVSDKDPFNINPSTASNAKDVETNDKIAIFLFNGSTLVDFVTDISSAQASNHFASILPFILTGTNNTLNLNANVTAEKLVLGSLGASKSYRLTNIGSSPCSYQWTDPADNNRGIVSVLINNTATWDQDYYFWTSTTKQSTPPSSNDYTTSVFSEITGSLADNGSTLSTGNFEFFLYIVNPTQFLDPSRPGLEMKLSIFADKGTPSPVYNSQEDSYVGVYSGTGYQFQAIDENTIYINLNGVPNVPVKAYKISFDKNLVKIPNTKEFYTLYLQLTFATGSNCYTPAIQKMALPLALPVSLSNLFVKSKQSGNNISWTTSSEQNNKGFEVQRSIGNTNDFKTIGFVGTRAKDGNSQTEISYSFEDTDVKPGQTHFYRLNQIDFDGKSAFSPVKSIKPGSIESNLNVYPNPSQGSFTVNTGSTSGKLNIFVMDNTGRVVNQYMNVSTTNTKINNLKKGFYTLKIVNTESGEQSAQRVVVQ